MPIADALLSRRRLLGALAATPLVAAAPKSGPAAPPVSETAIGTYVTGKANAKLQLVEYFSFTCPACANFAATSDLPLRTGYINRGLVSLEYRNLVRDPLDMAASLLARAGGASKFPGHFRALMASQPQWLGRASKMPKEVLATWYEGEIAERLGRIARDTGLDAIMRARGVTAVQQKAALASEVAQAAVTATTNLARGADRITSTPSFILGGKMLDGAHDWAGVKSRLDLALRQV